MTININKNINNINSLITSSVITRFAPSPTGFMHIGNLRTALFSYLFAKNQKGKFLLRIEDTDRDRSRLEYVAGLFKDFKALGLNWDQEVVYQSQRVNIYEEFYAKLQQQNLIYRCFCSEEKLSLSRKIQLSQGLPPRYTGNCLKLSVNEINQKLANNELACWRFKIPKNVIVEFEDLIKGKQIFNSNDFGDFVIKRQDGSASFMFCSVIDDVLQGVTHVLRGEDHVSNTPRQLLILQALGLFPPKYGHFSLLSNGTENDPKLSKRSGSESIQDFLNQGYLPLALLNYLARLGHNFNCQENQLFNLSELALHFDLKHISSNAAAKHDLVHLKFWQKQAMLTINNQQLLEILNIDPEFNQILKNNKIIDNKLTEFLNLIKHNILMPKESIIWAKVLFANNLQELDFNLDLQNYFKNIDLNFLQVLTKDLDFVNIFKKLQKLGFAKKEIFINLRMIFTGKTSGPELNKIFEIMGTDRIQKRAQQIIEFITA